MILDSDIEKNYYLSKGRHNCDENKVQVSNARPTIFSDPMFIPVNQEGLVNRHSSFSMTTKKEIKRFHLQVATKLEALQEVLQWFEGLVSPYLTQTTGWQCEVALTEAFTNAVRHAHHNLPQSTPIDLEVKLCESFLEMRVWDQGKAFDLKAQLQANEKNITSLDKEGGRGLQFIKKLTDELQYLTVPNYRNCLVIRKKYSSSTQ